MWACWVASMAGGCIRQRSTFRADASSSMSRTADACRIISTILTVRQGRHAGELRLMGISHMPIEPLFPAHGRSDLPDGRVDSPKKRARRAYRRELGGPNGFGYAGPSCPRRVPLSSLPCVERHDATGSCVRKMACRVPRLFPLSWIRARRRDLSGVSVRRRPGPVSSRARRPRRTDSRNRRTGLGDERDCPKSARRADRRRPFT